MEPTSPQAISKRQRSGTSGFIFLSFLSSFSDYLYRTLIQNIVSTDNTGFPFYIRDEEDTTWGIIRGNIPIGTGSIFKAGLTATVA
jgi:hypothetical protein